MQIPDIVRRNLSVAETEALSLFETKNRPALATIIYFHGNGGNITNIGWVGENLSGRDFDVLLLDYRGYGRSEGEIEGEAALYADADSSFEYSVS